MKFYLRILLLSTASKVIADEGFHGKDHSHDNLKPHTHISYHHVENACAADVEKMCNEELLFSSDPFFNWVLSSFTTSGVHDMNHFIDQMFDSVLVSSASQSYASFSYEVDPTLIIVDLGVARLAAEKQPEEIPQLAHQLQTYGASFMLSNLEDNSEQFRMARRLTEMDTKTINYHVQLPFGPKNCCLRNAFEQYRVSAECAASISSLEKTFVFEDKLSRRQEAFASMMWIYVTTLTALTIMLALRVRKQDEAEVGESIDSNPVEEDVYYASGDNAKKKRVQPLQTIIFEGVPLQIV